MEPRPRLTLTLSPLDKILELTSKVFLLIMWGLAIYVFIKLPDIVPIHFNASGKADNNGSKWIWLILPLVATVFYFGLTKLNRYPHVFNYMVKITEANARKQYMLATRMLRFMKLAILIIFPLIILFVYLTTIGVTNGLGFWFLPFVFAVLLIPTIITIVRSFQQKNIV